MSLLLLPPLVSNLLFDLWRSFFLLPGRQNGGYEKGCAPPFVTAHLCSSTIAWALFFLKVTPLGISVVGLRMRLPFFIRAPRDF